MKLHIPTTLLAALLVCMNAAFADETSTTLLNPSDGGVTSSGTNYFISQSVTWEQNYSYDQGGTATVLSVGTKWGDGELYVKNASTVNTAGSLHIGGWGWGSGYNSSIDPYHDGYVYVGEGSTLAVGTASGLSASNSQLNIGAGAGNATVVVDGGTMSTNYALNVGLGSNSHGELTIKNGGQVIVQSGDNISGYSSTAFYVGYYEGSEGKVTIEGEGSSLIVSAKDDGYTMTYMGLGNSSGVLEVKDGATVDLAAGGSSYTALGYSAEGSGAILVDDATLTMGLTYVGYSGEGEMTITNGADVEVDGQLVVSGWNAGQTGTVSVDGAESVLTVTGATFVGNGDGTSATFSVADGATAELQSVSVSGDSELSVASGAAVTVEGDMEVSQGASVTVSDGGTTATSLNVTGVYYNEGSTTVELTEGSSFSAGGVLNTGTMDISIESGSTFSTGAFVNAGDASITAAEGSTCELGNMQLVSGSMSLEGEGSYVVGSSASETIFTVSGATVDAATSTNLDISTLGSTNFTIDTSATFTFSFSDDIKAALIAVAHTGVDMEFTVIKGYEGFILNQLQLAELLSNTRYDFGSDVQAAVLAATEETSPYQFTVLGASYEMRGNDLVWTGTVKAIPEPTTATLSLLALAALAARRRRK